MNPRERWQALQSRLNAARVFANAGDRAGALREVDAALALDPNFLAAHSLRESLLTQPVVPAKPPSLRTAAQPVRVDSYSLFEQRALRRRVDRKIEAARSAIARRRLTEAAEAIDEIIELDANLPELSALTVQFDNLRRGAGPSRRRRWIAAAAAIAATITVGAMWLRPSSRSLTSHPTASVASLVQPAPAATIDAAGVQLPSEPPAASETAPRVDTPAVVTPPPVVATTGVRAPVPREPERPAVAERDRPARLPETVTPTPAPTPIIAPASLDALPAAPQPAPPAAPTARSATDATTIPPAPIATAPSTVTAGNSVRSPTDRRAVVPAVNDDQLVRQALQRYRSAYEGLDASSASAVYPAVNETALARAFDNLASQTLTFDSCDVQVRGDVANATCRGTTRYVPKVGSREPRIEPRKWTFALRRSAGDWKIDSARTER